MEDSEPQQLPVIEIAAEEQEPQGGQKKQALVRGLIASKRVIDEVIASKSDTVKKIFRLLQQEQAGQAEASVAKDIPDPEGVIHQLQASFKRLEQPTIEAIAQALVDSGSKIQDIQSWLNTNKNQIEALTIALDPLYRKRDDLSQEQTEEQYKVFLIKLFRGKQQREVTARLNETTSQIEELQAAITTRQSRVDQIESTLQELSTEQQALAMKGAEQLFQDISESRKQLAALLTTPEVKEKLNTDLLTKKVLPKLDELRIEGNLTKLDEEEYVDLLKIQLAEGNRLGTDSPPGKNQAINGRNDRLRKLNEKSAFQLSDIAYAISSEADVVPDSYYDQIFDVVLRDNAKQQIERLCDDLTNAADVKFKVAIAQKAAEVIHKHHALMKPYVEWEYRTESERKKDFLDLSTLPIVDFQNLKGLERWQILKSFVLSSGLISREVMEHVESTLTQRLFAEQLLLSGRESNDGSVAAMALGKLGNPTALPLLLRRIEASGSGPTNYIVQRSMEQLLRESDPVELDHVLSSLPRNKRRQLEALADKNSYMNRFGRWNEFNICDLLQKGDLTVAREQLSKMIDQCHVLDQTELRNFYQGSDSDSPKIVSALLQVRNQTETILIESKLNVWSDVGDKLLAALVNPRNGESIAFPKRITQEGLGITDETMLTTLEHIFDTKTVRGSGFEREALLDGLLLLNSKEDGKQVLETLLCAYRGAKNDPGRIRRIFQLLATLDGFGEYVFEVPNQAAAETVLTEIARLQQQYSKTHDAAERKDMKHSIEVLIAKRKNLTGLKNIEDGMTHRVVEAACRQLQLPQTYQDKIASNLETFLRSGLLTIIPTLAGKYQGMNEPEISNLLQAITAHIVDGDFKAWRYSHQQSEVQLAGLTEQQKEFWKETLPPITITLAIEIDGQERRAGELSAAKAIVENAKEHVLESQATFNFSSERARLLNEQIRELTKRIVSATSESEKRQLVVQKRALQAEETVIRGVLAIENATPESFTRESVVTHARALREKMLELNFPQAGLDIEQIDKIFTVGDIQSVTAYESDDPLTLLKVGVEPQETCQSWRQGGYNECLLAYVADSNKKVMNVADSEERVVARSVVKLTHQKDADDDRSNITLLVEKPYVLLPSTELYRAFIRQLLTKAQGLNCSITFGAVFDEKTLIIFHEEARAFGYIVSQKAVQIFIPHSLNKYEYSDALGGKISSFNRYQPLEAVTFEKAGPEGELSTGDQTQQDVG